MSSLYQLMLGGPAGRAGIMPCLHWLGKKLQLLFLGMVSSPKPRNTGDGSFSNWISDICFG